MSRYDVPDGPLEPPEPPPRMMWCDRCSHWIACPCGCGLGWCDEALDFTEPDQWEECGGFDGEPPEPPDPPDPDWR